MQPALVVRDQKDKIVGRIVLDGDALTGSTPSLQEIADTEVARLGTADAAFDALLNTSNGYVSFSEDTDHICAALNDGTYVHLPPGSVDDPKQG